jgi:NAD+ kinase
MSSPPSIGPARVVALCPSDGERAIEAAAAAAQWLSEHGVRTFVPRDVAATLPGCEPALDVPACDLAIALGGDGTLLRTARWVADAEIPVLGINLGTLGFLAAYAASELTEALQTAYDGKLSWEPRLRVKVVVERDGEVVQSQTACNDCYVKHGESPRMLQLVTEVRGSKMAEYRADGLIISTPMGSTAYNLAAGGPIVEPGTQTLVISPICPHSLTHRPVVTSADGPVRVRFVGPKGDNGATLSVDGQWGTQLQVGDTITVTRAETPLRLVPPSATVFEVLRAKLGWSGSL